MYIPSSFQETRLEVIHDLIRAHPLGLLVTGGAAGLAATQVPFLVYPGEGDLGTLRAHVARANPHWRELAGGAECLVVFQGEQGYVSPSWYPGKAVHHQVVPTWNYATVHAWGRPSMAEEPGWLHRQLEDLTRSQERRRARPWAVGDAPADFMARQMEAIVGIEIPIARIEGKWKMSQNREEADRAGVIAGLTDPDDAHRNPSLAKQVVDRNRPAHPEDPA